MFPIRFTNRYTTEKDAAMYQLLFKMKDGGFFALPVFGNKRDIWEALAKHMHYRTFKAFCEAHKLDPAQYKTRFKLMERSHV
jgi:hypothetical protein